VLLSKLSEILQNVNVAILPIIIIPVSGLCCLVFYNRLAALNNLLHALQKDLREFYLTYDKISDRQQSLYATLQQELAKVLRRSHLIRLAIVCCFSGILAFILSAISILLSTIWASSVMCTLVLWIIGALVFALGVLMGIFEIQNHNLQNMLLEPDLFAHREHFIKESRE